MIRVGERKQRSDKKKEVKPTLPLDLKDAIYRISYITYTPVKDVCEKLCVEVMRDQKILSNLSMYFQRDIRIGSTLYIGKLENKHIKKRIECEKEKVTIKFKREDYEIIYALGYALDCSPTRVVAILLQIAMLDMRIVNGYIKQYLESELTESQMKELKGLMKYINEVSDTHHSWASLLSRVVDEVGKVTRIKDAISDFLK